MNSIAAGGVALSSDFAGTFTIKAGWGGSTLNLCGNPLCPASQKRLAQQAPPTGSAYCVPTAYELGMHAGAFGDLVDEFLVGAQRHADDLGVLRSEFGKDGAVGRIKAGGKHLFDIG